MHDCPINQLSPLQRSPSDGPRHTARLGLRLSVAWAVLVACNVTSNAATDAGGAQHHAAATRAPIDGRAGAARGPMSDDGAHVVQVAVAGGVDAGGLGAFRLDAGDKRPDALGADLSANAADAHGDGGSWLIEGMAPIRSVPEPSELALLGDGLLVLIAWIAGRQARRSRSMAAMTADHEG